MKALLIILMCVASIASAQWVATGPYGGHITNLRTYGDLYATLTPGGLFKTSDGGINWTPLNTGIESKNAYDVYVNGTRIVLVTSSDIQVSTDGGSSWVRTLQSSANRSMIEYANQLFVGAFNVVRSSVDQGDTWDTLAADLGTGYIYRFCIKGSKMFLGAASGVFVSNDTGKTWVQSSVTLSTRSFVVVGETIYAGTDDGIHVSNDNGDTWNREANFFGAAHAMAYYNSILHVADGNTISRKTPEGWTSYSSPMRGAYWAMYAGSGLFIGWESGLKYSSDGLAWIDRNTGLTAISISDMIRIGSKLVAGTTFNGLFVSTDAGLTWSRQQTALSTDYVSVLYNDADTTYLGTNGNGLFRSVDNGVNWDWILPVNNVISITRVQDTLYALDDRRALYKSANGLVWDTAHTNLDLTRLYRLYSFNNRFFAGMFGDGIYTSRDNRTFFKTNNGMPAATTVYQMRVFKDSVLLSGTAAGLYYRTRSDTVWKNIFSDMPTVRVEVRGDTIVCIYNRTYRFVVLSGALGKGSGIMSWDIKEIKTVTQSPTNLSAPLFEGSSLLLGSGTGIYKGTLTDVVSKIENISNVIPKEFKLEQNYPNPFNPSTVIIYNLTKAAAVDLVIYDLLGKQVQVLISEVQSPGRYQVTWDAKQHATGVYLCRLQVDGVVVSSRKLLLLK